MARMGRQGGVRNMTAPKAKRQLPKGKPGERKMAAAPVKQKITENAPGGGARRMVEPAVMDAALRGPKAAMPPGIMDAMARDGGAARMAAPGGPMVPGAAGGEAGSGVRSLTGGGLRAPAPAPPGGGRSAAVVQQLKKFPAEMQTPETAQMIAKATGMANPAGGSQRGINLDARVMPDGRAVGRDANNQFPDSTMGMPPVQPPNPGVRPALPPPAMQPMPPGGGLGAGLPGAPGGATAPPMPGGQPAWQQLRQMGIGGQGSAAANRAKLAEMNRPQRMIEPEGFGGPAPGGGLGAGLPGAGGVQNTQVPPQVQLMSMNGGGYQAGPVGQPSPPMDAFRRNPQLAQMLRQQMLGFGGGFGDQGL